jgi:hypothetical protein
VQQVHELQKQVPPPPEEDPNKADAMSGVEDGYRLGRSRIVGYADILSG